MRQDTGIEPELFERGRLSGTEQGLDQVLQTHMLRAGFDNLENPQIAVLLTGDGAGFNDGVGFHADLERLHKNGWGVEVVAWDISCRKQLRDWAQNTGAYIRLEDYYRSVTFVERIRVPQPLNLTSRPRSIVGESPIARARQEAEVEASNAKKELESLQERIASKQKNKEKYNKKLKRRAENKKHRH